MRSTSVFLASLLLTGSAFAAERREIEIAPLATPPVIDGDIGDQEWVGAVVVDEYFVQVEPEYGEKSPFRTVVRVGQTGSSLFVAFIAFDPDPSRIAAAITRRPGP